jgi:hypothetical protein
MNEILSASGAELKMNERVFNDDLLMNPGDFQYAKHQFPGVFDILDHPELREEFRKYDRIANRAKVHVRWLGIVAVTSASVALLSTATEPLWQNLPGAGRLRVIFEICGLIAAIIASGSLWLGPWRKRWLEGRFMTERLRQWHFQLLVCKGSEIEALLNQRTSKSLEDFRSSRKIWFDDFLHEYAGKLDSRMDSLTSDPDFASDWLHRRTAYSHDSSALKMVSDPYRRLRVNHQYDYATHKLSEATDHPFWQFLKWPLLRQDSAIRAAVSFCFVVALLSSVGIIINRYFDVRPGLDSYLGISALVTAILGIAFRTVQEGLGITRDIERYRDYRGKVRRILLFFEETEDLQQRIQLMQEMELMVVDELRGFLRTHRGATFIL